MKFMLLPLTRKQSLVYCQTFADSFKPQRSYVKLETKVTKKINATWVKWESTKSGWRKGITNVINKALDRIPYEEWCLRTIPPESITKHPLDEKSPIKYTITYPQSFIMQETIPQQLEDLVHRRKPYHLKQMIICGIAAPLTLPIALLPIIPNIPGFYLLYRVWCHRKAYLGAAHLQTILDKKVLQVVASKKLDDLYKEMVENKLQSNDDGIILEKEYIPRISALIDDPRIEKELERALHQIRHDIVKKDI